MKVDERVKLLQASTVIFPVTVGTVFFPVAGIVVPMAGEAGWIAVLVAFVIAVPWVYIAASLAGKAPVGDWGQAVKSWLGPVVGRVFLLYFAFVWAWLGALLLTQGGLVFHNIALPRTPPVVLTIAILLLVIMADLRGVEVFVRTVEALAMIALPLVLGFFVVAIGSVELNNLKPLFAEAPIRIVHAVYMALPWVMEGILFALFIGTHVKAKKGLAMTASLSIIGAGLVLALVTMVTLGVLGRGVTESYIYPTVALAQVVHIGFFLQGLELFLYPLWLITSFIKVAAAFLLVSESLRGLWAGFKQPYRALAVGAIFYGIASIPDTIPQVVASVGRVDYTFFMLFYAILPVVWIWVRATRKGETNSNAAD